MFLVILGYYEVLNTSFSYYNGMSDVSFLQHNFDINMTL